MLTVLPDYLFRRYVQGKRFGREITLYSVWFELRWGIVTCLVLTVSLITMIFYFHPATKSAASYFRTVPVLPEGMGRVAEVYAGIREQVEAGQPLFKLDSSEQEAALETARRRIEEIEAGFELAQAELEAAEAESGWRKVATVRPWRSWRRERSSGSATRTRCLCGRSSSSR
jgi:multidrug resistance efflux pump